MTKSEAHLAVRGNVHARCVVRGSAVESEIRDGHSCNFYIFLYKARRDAAVAPDQTEKHTGYTNRSRIGIRVVPRPCSGEADDAGCRTRGDGPALSEKMGLNKT